MNKEINNSLILLMNLTKEHLAPADCYPKLYDKFIAIIKDKLSIIESVKNKDTKSIFELISLENRGDAELIINYFLSGGDINIREPYNNSLMSETISGGRNYFLSHFFIIHGVDISLTNKQNYTALNLAALFEVKEIVKLLLFYGSNPNIYNKNHETPLITLCNLLNLSMDKQNLHEIIKVLSNCPSVDINKFDEKGRTPLHKAVKKDSIEAVKILLDAGADKNIKNKAGRTALDLANEQPQFLNSTNEIIKLLGGEIPLANNDLDRVLNATKVTDNNTEEYKSPSTYLAHEGKLSGSIAVHSGVSTPKSNKETPSPALTNCANTINDLLEGYFSNPPPTVSYRSITPGSGICMGQIQHQSGRGK